MSCHVYFILRDIYQVAIVNLDYIALQKNIVYVRLFIFLRFFLFLSTYICTKFCGCEQIAS